MEKIVIQEEYDITTGKYKPYKYVYNGSGYDKQDYNRLTKTEEYALITVNPIPGTTTKDLLQLYKRAREKNWIINTYSCFEWRGIDVGLHLHMCIWLKKHKAKSQIHREMYNTFKSLVKYKLHINVQINKLDPGHFITYINGVKGGLPKKNSENDKKLREKYSLTSILEWLQIP